MAFLVSPGVEIKERDLTNIIPAVSSSTGAFAGVFEWGPVDDPTVVSSEKDLIATFGYPRKYERQTSAVTYSGSGDPWSPRDDWYSAANFLEYSNDLRLTRIIPSTARNAVSEYLTGEANKISIELREMAGLDQTAAHYADVVFDAINYSSRSTDQVDFTVPRAYDTTHFSTQHVLRDNVALDSDVIADVRTAVNDQIDNGLTLSNAFVGSVAFTNLIPDDGDPNGPIVVDPVVENSYTFNALGVAGSAAFAVYVNGVLRQDVTVTDDIVNNRVTLVNNGPTAWPVTTTAITVFGGNTDDINRLKAFKILSEIKDVDDRGVVTRDGTILLPDFVLSASSSTITDAIYTDGWTDFGGNPVEAFETLKTNIIDAALLVLTTFQATNPSMALDSDTVKVQRDWEDADMIAEFGLAAADGANTPAFLEAQRIIEDRVTTEIRNRKAYYGYDIIDNGAMTYGSLDSRVIIEELVTNNVIDSETYDSDNSCVFGGDLDFSEMKLFKHNLYGLFLAERTSRLNQYAALVDERFNTPYISRVAAALSTALEADGLADIDTRTSASGTPVVSFSRNFQNVTLAAPDASSTNNDFEFRYTQIDQMDPGMTTYSPNVIRNPEHFLTSFEGLQNGSVHAKFPGKLGNSIGVVIIDAGISATDFANTRLFGDVTASAIFDAVPRTSVKGEANHSANLLDEVHVVVYTTDTRINGVENDILETYAFLSKDREGKNADGGSSYYVDYVNNNSSWVYLLNEEQYAYNAVQSVADGTNVIAIGTSLVTQTNGTFNALATNVSIPGVRRYDLRGGLDGVEITDADVMAGFDLFSDVETLDISLVLTGNYSKNVAKRAIELCEARKDCIAVVSPSYSAAVATATSTAIADYFNNSTDGFNSTSYAVFDSGWKRQYDRHNDEYFWISLNPDIAGLMARTDYTNDPWWSPAGLNRGTIRNVVKLSFNPNQTDRDVLYTQRINPVVTFRGQGTILYGDKTALSRPSAFDRINVRRLFIVLEKAIATAAKFYLFEFNDEFTRRSFLNAVEPYLSNVQTRRGVTDFRVVCDESNNTGEVIDNNRFVADIYIKPNRSINYITLSFVAVRTGVEFNEVVSG